MKLSDDGYSIKGCLYIYAPKGRAEEYARLAANPYRGCGHGCAYCYVPNILRGIMTRAEFDAGATLRPDFLKHLEKDAAKYQAAGISENVLLSFTTDPYHPGDTSATRETIKILQDHGLRVTTLTKGGRRALRDIDLFRPGQDMFASTLTATDTAFSRKWERGAAAPVDRMETLKVFHNAGIFTWVSLEPVLNIYETLNVIEITHRYVDFYKVGKANYIALPEPINWQQFTNDVTILLSICHKAHYVKKDLQPYLPAGYKNTRLEDLQIREFPRINDLPALETPHNQANTS
jgi:DNA repair photolyase